MTEDSSFQTFYLDRREFGLLIDSDIVDAILVYKQQCRNSKHWTIMPEDALRTAVDDVLVGEVSPWVEEDYLARKKRQLTDAMGLLTDLAGYSSLESCMPVVGSNERGEIIVTLMDDNRFTVMVQLQDHIGYEAYKSTFLEPFELINKTIMPHADKVALYGQIKKIIGETFDEICMGDPSVKVAPDHALVSKHFLGSYDFNMGHSTFSDVFHYHLGNMAIYYCSVLFKLHMGQYVNGVFKTDFAVKEFDPELGYIILIHCPDTV